MADALVQQGERLASAGDAAGARAAFGEALAAYERSCGLSDSEAGDDLPSLLHNWGVGLHSVSKAAQVCGQRMRAAVPSAAAPVGCGAATGTKVPALFERLHCFSTTSMWQAGCGYSCGHFGGDAGV
jgi:hypothetical protein